MISKSSTVIKAQILALFLANSQFNCCAAVWMFFCRKPKLKLGKLYKHTLKAAFNKYEKNSKDLRVDHGEISIHQKYLQFSATVVFIGQMN